MRENIFFMKHSTDKIKCQQLHKQLYITGTREFNIFRNTYNKLQQYSSCIDDIVKQKHLILHKMFSNIKVSYIWNFFKIFPKTYTIVRGAFTLPNPSYDNNVFKNLRINTNIP